MQCVAILKVKTEATEERQAPLRQPEASEVWQLMQEDVLRSIHFIPGPGALLQLEVKDEAEANVQINRLPMVREGIVSVELFPLKPFSGLDALFGSTR